MTEVINEEEKKLQVVACPHPLKQESFFYYVKPNQTIDEVIHIIQPDEELAKCVNVWLNDQIVLPERYKETVVKEDDKLCMRYALQGGGGGGKNVLNIVLTVAVMVAAFYSGQWYLANYGTLTAAGTYTAGSLFTAGVIQATVATVGMLAVNAVVPPYVTDPVTYDASGGDTKYSLEAGGNQVNRFGSVLAVLGKHKIYPQYAANPYTEQVGNDSYLRLLLNWGYGPLEVSDIKIGDTPIEEYKNVEYEYDPMYSPDDPLTLFPGSVQEESIGLSMDKANASITRTTAMNTEEISLDFSFPAGMYTVSSESGNTYGHSRSFLVEYRESGTEEWLPLNIASEEKWETVKKKVLKFKLGRSFTTTKVTKVYVGTNPTNKVVISARSKTAFVKTYRYVFDKAGQYDIRVTALNNGYSGQMPDGYYTYVTTCRWGVLRSFKSDVPVLLDGLALSAFYIKATDQLNGAITDLTGVVTSVLPDWDKETQTWIDRPTNNPASIFKAVLQENMINKPLSDAQVDLKQLQHWHEYCEEKGFECNLIIEKALPLNDLLGKIASTGRATPAWLDGKRTVIIDEPKLPKQVVTPRNSWNFSATKEFTDIPHAWRIPFANEEKEYLTDEYVVYADGYNASNATIYETLSFEGVTNPMQIFKMGKYYHNVAKLRPETYSFNMDMENLVCNRGDVMIIHHDVPAYGIKSARIKQVILDDNGDCTAVILDDFVIFEQDRSYYLRNRYKDGSFGIFNITNQYVADDMGVEKYTMYFEKPLTDLDIPNEGDLCMIGVNEIETAKVLIKSITPQNDLSALIEAVNYDENIYSTGVIPPFESKITLAPEYYYNKPKGPKVSIDSVYSDETAALVSLDGSIQPRILVNFSVAQNTNNVMIDHFEIQWKDSQNDFWNKSVNINSSERSYYIAGIDEGQSVDIRIRSYAQIKNFPGTVGQPSDWATHTVESVVGTSSVPPDIEKLMIENRHLTWKYPNKPIDFLGYEVRQLGGENPIWELGTSISSGLLVQTYFDIDNRTTGKQVYMVKAVDKNYKYSKNAAYVLTDFGYLGIENVKDIVAYRNDWLGLGSVTGGTVDPITGNLQSQISGAFWDGIPNDIFWGGIADNYFWGGSYKDMLYITEPYTVVADGRLTLQFDISSIYGYFIEYREYEDGLGENEQWYAWSNYLNVAKGEKYQFRISCYQGTNPSVISDFTLINDTADQSEFFNDLVVPPEGLRVPITKNYEVIKTLTYALQTDGNGGISIIVEDKNAELGPLIRVVNDLAEPVQGLVDVTVYGVPKT